MIERVEYEAQAVLETHGSVACDCGCEDDRRGDWNEIVTSCPDPKQAACRRCGDVGYRMDLEEGGCPACGRG